MSGFTHFLHRSLNYHPNLIKIKQKSKTTRAKIKYRNLYGMVKLISYQYMAGIFNLKQALVSGSIAKNKPYLHR